jgi:hypothetical protein
MARSNWWHRWGRFVFAGVLSGGVIWYAFLARRPVPLLDWFDLAIHEAGHLIAAPMPEWFMFMAGSIAQVIFPLTMAWYFGMRRRDSAGAGFCLMWAGASALDVSIHAADAVAQSLPLVGAGEHDWAYILGHFGVLDKSEQIATAIEVGGGVLAAIGLSIILYGALMATTVKDAKTPSTFLPVADPGGAPLLEVSELPFRFEDKKESVVGVREGPGESEDTLGPLPPPA